MVTNLTADASLIALSTPNTFKSLLATNTSAFKKLHKQAGLVVGGLMNGLGEGLGAFGQISNQNEQNRLNREMQMRLAELSGEQRAALLAQDFNQDLQLQGLTNVNRQIHTGNSPTSQVKLDTSAFENNAKNLNSTDNTMTANITYASASKAPWVDNGYKLSKPFGDQAKRNDYGVTVRPGSILSGDATQTANRAMHKRIAMRENTINPYQTGNVNQNNYGITVRPGSQLAAIHSMQSKPRGLINRGLRMMTNRGNNASRMSVNPGSGDSMC